MLPSSRNRRIWHPKGVMEEARDLLLGGRLMSPPLVSIVVPTRNRADDLRQALVALLGLRARSAAFEIIVVDNGSSDNTWRLLEILAEREPRLQAVHEPRAGISYARNAGIAKARGSIVAFTDDDIRVSEDWVDTIAAAFAGYPDAQAVGGRVLPSWPVPPPAWLRRESWGPLAIVDYGPEPIIVDHDRPLCLIGANVAMRASAFKEVGLFSPAFPRGQDQEWLERLYARGGFGVYLPSIVVSSPIASERLTKHYHRAWHYRRGRFLARMRLPRLEATRMGRLFNVPAHIWRACVTEAFAAAACCLRRQPSDAFAHACAALCHAGFVRERVAEWAAQWAPPKGDPGGPVLAPAGD
jgi:glycosyltransferase involved in cell wall biosynthesis